MAATSAVHPLAYQSAQTQTRSLTLHETQAQRKEIKRHWPLLSRQNRLRLLQCQCGHSPQTATHLWNECPLARQHLSVNLCSPQDLPKFLRAVFSPDVQLPEHQLIRTLVHNYETLGNNMGTTTDSMLQAVTAAIAEHPWYSARPRPLVGPGWPVGA